MRVTACNIVLLADRQDLVDGRSHCRVVVLPGIAEILRQVALTDDYHADTGYLLEHVRQVFDRPRLLAHDRDQNLALWVERPNIGARIIFRLVQPRADPGARSRRPSAGAGTDMR